MYFKVKPTAAFKLAGTSTVLDPHQTYCAIDATNLPDWRDTGSIWLLTTSDGAPAPIEDADTSSGFLLKKGEYTLTENRPANPKGYTGVCHDCGDPAPRGLYQCDPCHKRAREGSA